MVAARGPRPGPAAPARPSPRSPGAAPLPAPRRGRCPPQRHQQPSERPLDSRHADILHANRTRCRAGAPPRPATRPHPGNGGIGSRRPAPRTSWLAIVAAWSSSVARGRPPPIDAPAGPTANAPAGVAAPSSSPSTRAATQRGDPRRLARGPDGDPHGRRRPRSSSKTSPCWRDRAARPSVPSARAAVDGALAAHQGPANGDLGRPRGRSIPVGCVARRYHPPRMRPPRALPSGRLDRDHRSTSPSAGPTIGP
jgi:translation initiation factor IF-2